ncbi:MAG: hypothetical protein H6756_00440 [Candidatus Omnitrophica bacterium]|nr:hypothetical protein [Candidatus Omnitrophota bacterium]MCB9719322.1 hypothetical protein [Candidatus Omnitrophota bacterium]
MNNQEIKKEINAFVLLIEHGAGSSVENFKELLRVLDALALAIHYVKYTYDENELPDPPRRSYEDDRKLATERFPDFGHYNRVLNVVEKLGHPDFGMGDAFDDITDIYGEMKMVQWRWDHNGPDDALWCFSDMYGFHWKRHLRNLQLYLCEWMDSDGDGK